ncbi:MAG: recombinase family protein [Epsilonproteobacteria bacterium]|nr:recombinase family protein [Campylobacterota bacterium]
MVIAYIRPDKNFASVHEQLQMINSYAVANNILIDDEFIDQTSQSKRLEAREEVTSYFRNTIGSTLLVYDAWVLSTNMEDVTQMFSCLLKNKFTVHFVRQSVIISEQSNAMLVLGLMDELRQRVQDDSKKVIGRPKGSKSSSKFDIYMNDILEFIQQGKSVSEMARELNVSRSSLKDFIESRELKLVAHGSLLPKVPENAEEQVINKISCPQS